MGRMGGRDLTCALHFQLILDKLLQGIEVTASAVGLATLVAVRSEVFDSRVPAYLLRYESSNPRNVSKFDHDIPQIGSKGQFPRCSLHLRSKQNLRTVKKVH